MDRKLISKYRTDNLTPSELLKAREEANAMSDDDLSALIEDDWNSASDLSSEVDPMMKERVYKRIMSESRHGFVWHLARLGKIAAALLIPVLVISTFYFYGKFRDARDITIACTTHKSESVVLTLPDGSVVDLNGSSSVRYNPVDFVNKSRTVSFNGDAYFDIAKKDGLSFTIEAGSFQVIVTGTTFDLFSDSVAKVGAIYLIDGNVTLHSKENGKSVPLHPNEKALWDDTGNIVVSEFDDNDNPTYRQTGYLTYRKAPLPQVIRQLERCYGCEIEYDSALDSLTFTGKLPATNLGAAAEVLNKSFDSAFTVL